MRMFPTYVSPDPDEGVETDPVFSRQDRAIDRLIDCLGVLRGVHPPDALRDLEREVTRSGFHDAKQASKLIDRFEKLNDVEFGDLLQRLGWLTRRCTEDLVLLAHAARCPAPIERVNDTFFDHRPELTDDEDDEMLIVVPTVDALARLRTAVDTLLRDVEPLARRYYDARDALAVAQNPFAD
jgi:hypothetical protein